MYQGIFFRSNLIAKKSAGAPCPSSFQRWNFNRQDIDISRKACSSVVLENSSVVEYLPLQTVDVVKTESADFTSSISEKISLLVDS